MWLINIYWIFTTKLYRIWQELYSNKTIKLIRNFGNKLGIAWWAKIETDQPRGTYWFGPFITKRSLKENLSSFIKDLSDEGSKNIKHSLFRCKKEEPLTV